MRSLFLILSATVSLAEVPAGVPMQAPVSPAAASLSEEEQEMARPVYREVGSDQILITELSILGWIQDSHGVTVVLRDAKDRYYFRGGHLRYRDAANAAIVPGVEASIDGKNLVLRNPKVGGTVRLPLTPDKVRERL